MKPKHQKFPFSLSFALAVRAWMAGRDLKTAAKAVGAAPSMLDRAAHGYCPYRRRTECASWPRELSATLFRWRYVRTSYAAVKRREMIAQALA